jgi:hypothetical protein
MRQSGGENINLVGFGRTSYWTRAIFASHVKFLRLFSEDTQSSRKALHRVFGEIPKKQQAVVRLCYLWSYAASRKLRIELATVLQSRVWEQIRNGPATSAP